MIDLRVVEGDHSLPVTSRKRSLPSARLGLENWNIILERGYWGCTIECWWKKGESHIHNQIPDDASVYSHYFYLF